MENKKAELERKVGVSPKKKEDKPLGRRSALIGMAGWGLAAAGAAGVASSIFRAAKEVGENITSLDYREIPQGAKLLLDRRGSGERYPITVQYFGVESLKARKDFLSQDGDWFLYNPIPFSSGSSNERLAGEILDLRIYQLKLNPQLERAGVYRNAEGSVNLVQRIEDRTIKPGDIIWGLKVAAYFDPGIFPEGLHPVEVNPHSGERMTQGWAIGRFIEPSSSFEVMGYVKDPDVLVEA